MEECRGIIRRKSPLLIPGTVLFMQNGIVTEHVYIQYVQCKIDQQPLTIDCSVVLSVSDHCASCLKDTKSDGLHDTNSLNTPHYSSAMQPPV